MFGGGNFRSVPRAERRSTDPQAAARFVAFERRADSPGRGCNDDRQDWPAITVGVENWLRWPAVLVQWQHSIHFSSFASSE